MTTPVRVLIVEDSEDDAMLLLRELRRGGYDPAHTRVDTAEDMRAALAREAWDIVISDYAMPRFSGLAAVHTLQASDLDLPIIIVSGTVGEDTAVETMRAGAHDYIMKDNLTRLTEAMRRELREAEVRRERRAAEQALYQERERAFVTLHSIGDGVVTTDARGLVDFLNPVAERLTGWSSAEAHGKPLENVLQLVNEITGERIESPAYACLRGGCVVELANNIILISRDGQRYAIEDSAAPIRDRGGNIIGVVLVFHDVSQERSMARQISWQASHDALTGLVNRCEFEARLNRLLESAREHRLHHSMLYIDLDQFKVVNDTCGHMAGDELLKQLTSLLEEQIAQHDVLARLGGDEFGVLLENHDLERALGEAEHLLNVIRNYKFQWQGANFEIGASIGVASIVAESVSPGSVLSAADVACYMAKDMGRNRIHVYQAGDTDLARRHGEMQWVARITQALDERRFLLYRQAILPLNSGHSESAHYELLIRLRDVDGTLVPPGNFIPAAERYNLMSTLDRWVVRTAFDHLARESRNGALPVNYTINLSGTSLNDDVFLKDILKQIREGDFPPERVCFEITETAAIANIGSAIRFINELKQVGCRFALDDFGSGLSSFAYLKNLPVDYLKIDGNFVKDMLDDPMDEAIVESINQIGHIMGMKTIAEFVENDAILRRVRELGIDYAQGYGVEKPRPLDG